MFRSNNPKDMAREVDAAYDNRIYTMCDYGSDSPEGLIAEVQADDMAAAFRDYTGQEFEEYLR
jgi:hypothetical protein